MTRTPPEAGAGGPGVAAGGARFSPGREVALGLGVYAVYLAVRRATWTDDGRRRARRNAAQLVALERRAGLLVEPRVQALALRFPRLVQVLNVGYAVFNVGLTVGWLLRLYRRRDPGYHRFRRTAVLAHLAAEPVFLLFPAAPPRALEEEGVVDTLAELSGIDLEHPFLVRFYNPLAAMPSLHLAYAVVTAGALADRGGSRTRRNAARAYPPLVAAVVVATGNHYLADVAAGAALGAVARRLAA